MNYYYFFYHHNSNKKRGTPNPVADYHAASYPKWLLTAVVGQLPAKAVGWGSPLGSFRPITLYIT